ncbi:MAG: hypothetical protein WA064_02705 [Candidatus Moraniibacteriota bacterium]
MNQKTLISVLILLAAILGGTTIYFLTAQKSVAPVMPTPVPVSKNVPVKEKTSPVAQNTPAAPAAQDEAAGWKTYTNAKFEYSFQYPQELIIDDKNSENITVGSVANSYFNVSILANPTSLAIKTFAQNTLIKNAGGLMKVSDIKFTEKQILGQKAVEAEYKSVAGGYDGMILETFISRGDKVYEILALSDYKEMTQLQLQSKLVASFKFTK